MLPRRKRRLGVRYVENNRERDITFFKRRAGLFKSAADLAALTGAKVAIVMETENHKMHAFGTPSADPIIDAFLSGRPVTGPLTDEVTSTRIAWLESEVARLDMENAEVEKRTRLSIQRAKELQEEIASGTTVSLLSSKEKDLTLEDLNKLFTDLTLIQKEIQYRLPPLHRDVDPTNGAGTSSVPHHLALLGGHRSSWDHRSVPPPSEGSSWSPVPPVQPPPLASLAELPPQHNSTPLFPMQQVPPPMEPQPYNHHIMEMGRGSDRDTPQTLPSTPVPSAPQMLTSIPLPSPQPLTASPLQAHPDLVQDQLPLPMELHPQYYASTNDTVEPPQIYPSPDPTFQQYNEEALPLLVNSGGDDFVAGDAFANDHWAHALSEQPYYSKVLGFDGYIGYTGTDVSLDDIGNIGEWVDGLLVPGPSSK